MTHLTDDDIVLYYYAEGDALPEARTHLNECTVCRERVAELELSLSAVSASQVPERDESYGRTVWARVQPRLNERDRLPLIQRWLGDRVTLPRLAYGGGIAVLLVAAFAAGRYWPSSPVTQPADSSVAAHTATTDADTERMLLESVSGHLERSAMVLSEVANRPPGQTVDVSAEQSRAGDLVATNRLIRQTAIRQGENGLASVLEELERVLVEITNGPSPMRAADLDCIRQRIGDKGLLFKVRVLETQLRERQRSAANSTPAPIGKKL